MKDLKTYIESGILESYVLGSLSENEAAEVSKQIAFHPELQEEIEAISEALESIAFAGAIPPDPTVKPFLFATMDYITRLESGEAPAFPPVLNDHSTIADYAEWINRPDMVLPEKLEGFFAKIIGYTPIQITAIAWIEYMAPPEIHTSEHEKFLILEGTCDIQIDEITHHLIPGDYLEIPLHANHYVTVTSSIPCKVILQRIAA